MCFNTQPPEGGCIPARSPAQSCRSFNTQPPEGGCLVDSFILLANCLFQHTAARRRLLAFQSAQTLVYSVSTHSRPKAAALLLFAHRNKTQVSTHSRPKAAAANPATTASKRVFQHTAARRRLRQIAQHIFPTVCFNTQPPEGGCISSPASPPKKQPFQHTAARRRLRCCCRQKLLWRCRFNTQPPEGGCENLC